MTWTGIARRLAVPPLEGVAAETVALIVALGIVFGTFPMYGARPFFVRPPLSFYA